MKKLKSYMPLKFITGTRATKVTFFQRLITVFFGAPNFRRANGIIYSGMDLFGEIKRFVHKARGKKMDLPIYEIDRIGTVYDEKLPRIWLSEELFNTNHDGEGRIFVECYPTSPDLGGLKALELADRYLCEGFRKKKSGIYEKSKECFQAAEILYLHAIRRGNREAARSLKSMYDKNLCEDKWFESYLCSKAKHALKQPRTNKRCA